MKEDFRTMFSQKHSQPTVSNPLEHVVMCSFLAQFSAQDNWAVMEKDLINKEALDLAKEMGFVANCKPPKGSTYYETLVCTLRGRLYIRKNT